MEHGAAGVINVCPLVSLPASFILTVSVIILIINWLDFIVHFGLQWVRIIDSKNLLFLFPFFSMIAQHQRPANSTWAIS